jgi:hypothetical protein
MELHLIVVESVYQPRWIHVAIGVSTGKKRLSQYLQQKILQLLLVIERPVIIHVDHVLLVMRIVVDLVVFLSNWKVVRVQLNVYVRLAILKQNILMKRQEKVSVAVTCVISLVLPAPVKVKILVLHVNLDSVLLTEAAYAPAGNTGQL